MQVKPITHLAPARFAELAPTMKLVDVRGEAEYSGELGHVPGAIRVPVEQLAELVRAWGIEQPVGVICRTGRRSTLAAFQLAKAGVRVFNLDGGTMAWRAAGFRTCTGHHPKGAGCDQPHVDTTAEQVTCSR